jgi:hypothetical protein
MDRPTQDDRNGRHQQAALPGEGDSNKAMEDSLILSSPGEEEDIRSKVPSQVADDGLRSRRSNTEGMGEEGIHLEDFSKKQDPVCVVHLSLSGSAGQQ